jgi:hypothetical protein
VLKNKAQCKEVSCLPMWFGITCIGAHQLTFIGQGAQIVDVKVDGSFDVIRLLFVSFFASRGAGSYALANSTTGLSRIR